MFAATTIQSGGCTSPTHVGRALYEVWMLSAMILLALVLKPSAEATDTTSPAAVSDAPQCPAPNINIQVRGALENMVQTFLDLPYYTGYYNYLQLFQINK